MSRQGEVSTHLGVCVDMMYCCGGRIPRVQQKFVGDVVGACGAVHSLSNAQLARSHAFPRTGTGTGSVLLPLTAGSRAHGAAPKALKPCTYAQVGGGPQVDELDAAVHLRDDDVLWLHIPVHDACRSRVGASSASATNVSIN